MAELNDILLSVILILGSLVLIVLIFVLVRVSNSLQSVEAEVKKLTADLQPLIQRITGITEQAQTLLNEINEQKDILETSVMRVRDMSESIYEVFRGLYVELAPTVESVSMFLARIRRGVTTFLDTWKAAR
jgi:uncharacterized protein YoxC